MELTREQVIEELQKMLDYCSIRQDSTPERKQALVYAISSLKTDEAYQLMYEGGEIFTKADMVAILEEIDLQFDEICFSKKGEWKTVPEIKAEYKAIIQQKINELKQEPTTKIEESNFSQEQYKADLQSAYDCGKSVIDKIRAEIEQLRLHKAQFITSDNKVCIDSQAVLDIIDKYKAEGEPQESEDQTDD